MCNCHSYNGDIESTKETDKIKEILIYNPKEKKEVCIDACIAPTIKALWEAGIETENSCCGHGGRIKHFTDYKKPSIVVPTVISISDIKKARTIIAEIDGRDWNIYAWKLTSITNREERKQDD